MEFKSYKRIVIVGNGGSSINSKNGTFIDNSDIVVRLKSFVTKDFEDYVGSKTSIWFTKWFSYRKTNIQKIWLPFINPDNFILDDKIKSINAFLFLNQRDLIFNSSFPRRQNRHQGHQDGKSNQIF